MEHVDKLVFRLQNAVGGQVDDLLDGVESALDLLYGNVVAVFVGDQDRLYAQQIAEEGGTRLDSAGSLERVEVVHGNELVDVILHTVELLGDLLGAHALVAQLGALDRYLTFAAAGVEGVYHVDLRVGIALEHVLGDDLSGVNRAGELGGTADIHDIIALFEILLEASLKFVCRNLRGGHAVAAADGVIQFLGAVEFPVKAGNGFLALTDGVHSQIIDIESVTQLPCEVGAGIS